MLEQRMRLLHLLLVGFSLGFSGAAGGFVTHVESGCMLDEEGSVKDFTYCISFNKDVLTCWDSEANKMAAVDFGILNPLAKKLSEILSNDSALMDRLSKGLQDCAIHTKPFWGALTQRTRPPSVQIAQTTPFNTRESVMLACYVWGFYPADVAILWLKNGQPIPNSGIQKAVQSNGDWTYQTRSYLPLTPSSGDIYTCHVEHSGTSQPILQTWTPGLSLKQTVKISVSVLTLSLGLTFFFLGLVACRKAGPSDYTPLSGSNYPEGRNFS
ncbi:HLA class II histocompatibility antigen, DM beta chain isoform X1 [Phascolarctos cinereus]|uniref:HLA class II histocompatibility antigen, DM beta chain isoform X1 n=2 Tax=Phascolarctos cinereus TaxID=38626 RepID=A0A0U3YUC6_PHACI|nr:HLA class II histocompatibility antigen, DM beta chain isoform X1 [Phascolarctos cinereus]ALX81651.1 MHC class II beta chain antigen [Phascolarctos cinereus]